MISSITSKEVRYSYNILKGEIGVNLENKTSELLLGIGIPPHVRGYRLLRRAIEMAYDDRNYLKRITKGLYIDLATEFSRTPSQVERNIRSAIQIAFDRDIPEYYKRSINPRTGKPANSEFIALCAEKLKMDESK